MLASIDILSFAFSNIVSIVLEVKIGFGVLYL